MDDLLLAARTLVSLGVVVALLLFLGRRLQKGQAAGRGPLASLVPSRPARSGGLSRLLRARPTAPARTAPEKITLVARAPLGGRAQLVVAEFGGIRYVLGVSEKGIDVVDTQEAPAAAGDADIDADTAENVIALADPAAPRPDGVAGSTAA